MNVGVRTWGFVHPADVNINSIVKILLKFIVIDLTSFGVKTRTIQSRRDKQIAMAESQASVLQLHSVSVAGATISSGYYEHFR